MTGIGSPKVHVFALMVVVLPCLAFSAPKKRPASKRPPKASVAVLLASVVDGSGTPGARDAAVAALRAALAKWQVTIAPDGVAGAPKKAGLELSVSLRSGKARSLDASMVVSTFPAHALRGEYRAGGSGAELLDLIPPVVEKLVADVAKDEGWAPAP